MQLSSEGTGPCQQGFRYRKAIHIGHVNVDHRPIDVLSFENGKRDLP